MKQIITAKSMLLQHRRGCICPQVPAFHILVTAPPVTAVAGRPSGKAVAVSAALLLPITVVSVQNPNKKSNLHSTHIYYTSVK